MADIDQLKAELLASVEAASSLAALEDVRVYALGKKGAITEQMKGLGALSADERKSMGQALNTVKDAIAAAIEAKQAAMADAELNAKLLAEKIDVTLPVRPETDGFVHPISQTIEEVVAILGEMGFGVAEGPEIEDDWYNFTALNIPEDHPARQEHDTFYLPGVGDKGRKVLRTHTSPVQIRTLLKNKPPLRIIAPGRTYRCDYDATHSPMFHQVEGLWVDEEISFANLKGVVQDFLQRFFERDDLRVRFRPSFFPFTEPSAEMDMSWNGGWLEIGGCGMVHPNVLKHVNIDSEKYLGFAFGLGVERLAMLRYGVNDLRLFYESDLRFLRQFN